MVTFINATKCKGKKSQNLARIYNTFLGMDKRVQKCGVLSVKRKLSSATYPWAPDESIAEIDFSLRTLTGILLPILIN